MSKQSATLVFNLFLLITLINCNEQSRNKTQELENHEIKEYFKKTNEEKESYLKEIYKENDHTSVFKNFILPIEEYYTNKPNLTKEYLHLELFNKAYSNKITNLFHLAIKHGNKNLFIYLFMVKDKLDLDIKYVNKYGENIYHYAAYFGHLDIIKFLFNYKDLDIKFVDEYGENMYHYAATNGHLHIIKYLFNNTDLDIKCVNRYAGENIYHYATANGHLHIIKYLFNNTDLDIKCENKYGENIYHYAAMNGHLKIIQYLFNKFNKINLDIKCIGKYWKNIYHYAAANGHLHIIQYLFNNTDLDIKCVNEYGENIYKYAAENGYLDIIKFLFNFTDLDIKHIDNYNQHLYHVATSCGKKDIIQYLITLELHKPTYKRKYYLFWKKIKGISPADKNKFGKTCLDIAIENRYNDMITLFLNERLICCPKINILTYIKTAEENKLGKNIKNKLLSILKNQLYNFLCTYIKHPKLINIKEPTLITPETLKMTVDDPYNPIFISTLIMVLCHYKV